MEPGGGTVGTGTQAPALGQVTVLPLSPQRPGEALTLGSSTAMWCKRQSRRRAARGPREKRCEKHKGTDRVSEEAETKARWQDRKRASRSVVFDSLRPHGR